MNLAKALATATFAFAALGLAGCGGGVEGTYKLDKAEVKKAMEADIATMPADQQGFAKLAMAMIDGMDMSIELQSGGKVKAHAQMPSLDPTKPGKTEDKEGTWKAEGDAITLDTGDGKALKCTKAGSKLTCGSAKKGEPALIFNKS
jgi:hypothetical protein